MNMQEKATVLNLEQFLEMGGRLASQGESLGRDRWSDRVPPWCTSVDQSWDGGVGSNEAMRRARAGDPSLVARAQAIKVPAIQAEGTAFKSALDVMGGSVNVGAYLTGHPSVMRRRQRVPKITRSVRIFWGIMPSAAWSTDQLLTRNNYLLALIDACQTQQIIVDLFVVFEGGHGLTCNSKEIVAVEIPTKPLDLSQISFLLAHPAFGRNVGYPIIGRVLSPNRWDDWTTHFLGGMYGDDTAWDTRVRQMLDLAPTDIYVPSPRYQDPIGPQWVAEQIEKLSCNQSE
jgi:hypothetical protein